MVEVLSPEKRWAMLCYLPVVNLITCIFTSLKMVNSNFCLLHARNGLVLIAVDILALLLIALNETLGLMFLGIVILLHIVGLYLACNLKNTPIPVVTSLAMRIPPLYIFKRLTGKEPEKPAT